MVAKIRTGDNVVVISGNFKKYVGRVKSVDVQGQKAVVEGVNLKTRFKASQNPDAALVRKEYPLHISNLAHVDPKTNKPTRVKVKRNEKGFSLIAKKSGEVVR